MSFPYSAINQACLAAMGSTYSYTHASTHVTEDITAIPVSRDAEQDAVPGEYVVLFVEVTSVSPQKGDQIMIDGDTWTAFKVVPDEGGGAEIFFQRVVNA